MSLCILSPWIALGKSDMCVSRRWTKCKAIQLDALRAASGAKESRWRWSSPKALRALWAGGTMTADEIAAQHETGRRTVFKYVNKNQFGEKA